MDTLPRVDKYLWSIRVFKTRTDSADACRGGKVLVNGLSAKPSREVKAGDLLEVRKGSIRYRYQILAPLEHRVAAKDLAPYVLDITPPEELAKGDAQNESLLVWRERGAGRPTKKERRNMDKLLNQFS